MNYEPYKNFLLLVLGSAGGYVINRGWLTGEQWAQLSGIIISIGGFGYAIWAGRQNAVIAAAANLKVVDQIKVNDATVADSTATPSNVTASR